MKKIIEGFSKVFGVFLGVLIGYGALVVVKWTILLSGAFILGSIDISGPRAARNLEATAEILGGVVFFLVLIKIYRAIAGKNKKPESTEDISKKIKES